MKNVIWRTFKSNQANVSDISSVYNEALTMFFKSFGHKEFMLHEVEGLPPHPIWNAYNEEKAKFLKTVQKVSLDKIPKYSNIITSPVIYKFKENDDGSLMVKARIAPHGNKDKGKFNLKIDSSQCPPTGIRIAISISTIMKWQVDKN